MELANRIRINLMPHRMQEERNMATGTMVSVENNLINITQTHTHIRILFASVFRFKYHFIISCFYAFAQVDHDEMAWIVYDCDALLIIVVCISSFRYLSGCFSLKVFISFVRTNGKKAFHNKNADFLISIGAKMLVYCLLF